MGECDSCAIASVAYTVAQGGVPEWVWGVLLGVVLVLIAWLEWTMRQARDVEERTRFLRIATELRRDHHAEWETKLKASKDAAHKALWPVDAPLDMGYKYTADLPGYAEHGNLHLLLHYPKTLEDWEIWLRAVHRVAMTKTKPHDDGTFTLVPSRDFPKELLPRLREFGFRLDIPPRGER